MPKDQTSIVTNSTIPFEVKINQYSGRIFLTVEEEEIISKNFLVIKKLKISPCSENKVHH